jgi:hypothetical protein
MPFDYFLLEKVQLSAGYKFTHHNYVPGKSKVIKSNESSEIKTFSYPESTSGEHNLYLQADINNISGFDFNAGLRT